MQKNTHHLSIHQRIERGLRSKLALVAALLVMMVALVKIDGRLTETLRHAYYEGFGMLSVYLHHEETARMPVILSSYARIATHSSGR